MQQKTTAQIIAALKAKLAAQITPEHDDSTHKFTPLPDDSKECICGWMTHDHPQRSMTQAALDKINSGDIQVTVVGVSVTVTKVFYCPPGTWPFL